MFCVQVYLRRSSFWDGSLFPREESANRTTVRSDSTSDNRQTWPLSSTAQAKQKAFSELLGEKKKVYKLQASIFTTVFENLGSV